MQLCERRNSVHHSYDSDYLNVVLSTRGGMLFSAYEYDNECVFFSNVESHENIWQAKKW